MSKHTPGPWTWSLILGYPGERLVTSKPHGPIICIMPPDPRQTEEYGVQWAARTLVEIEANMRLIAAAPKMLEALKATLSVLDSEQECKIYPANRAMVAEAIAQAEGE